MSFTVTRFGLFLLALWWGLMGPAAHSQSLVTANVSVADNTGLPQLNLGGAQAFSTSTVFWGANWGWAGVDSALEVLAPLHYQQRGQVKALGLTVQTQVQQSAPQQLQWRFAWDARSAMAPVIGGGLVFMFDLARFAPQWGEPSLLPGNAGWAWGKPGGAQLEMRFTPPLATVYFERGNKSEVRAFFYKDAIQPGTLLHTATLTWSDNVALVPTLAERFGLAKPDAWPTSTLDWKGLPISLAFLNSPEAPAGKRGFVKAVGEHLRFADGSVARFWGTNVSAYALFNTPKEVVQQQARRLSALGFNLVRLHHHDSPWVSPNVFGDSKKVLDTQTLSAEALDKLDWWIKCLKDEGIYVWLDLHVQRALRAGDAITGFDEMRKGKEAADLKGYAFVNPSIQQAMKRFNQAYVTHVNPHTGLAAKDEPAIAAMLITNENDLTNHFGNALLPDKNVPQHNRWYMAAADAFATRHGLPKDKVWRSWEHGPSKLFLNDLERSFNADLLAHLRSLGVRVPVATTSTWGNNPLSSLPALTTGDLVDTHAYGGAEQLGVNPLLAPNLVHWLAAAQVVGKPTTVTEWNAEPFPTPDRHTLPLYVAGSASLQGWSALMQYAYTQEPITSLGSASNWHAHNDPALLATLPAAALLYRQGHVQEARTRYVYAPDAATLFGQAVSADNAAALRTAAARGKLQTAMPATKELPWLVALPLPAGATLMRNANTPVLAPSAQQATSDTGELTHHWGQGTYTINTPRTQAAMGWVGGQSLRLQDIELATSTRNATVSVQALDGAAIAQSQDLLISVAARAVPQANNRPPFYTEPVLGVLKIRAPKGLRLYRPVTGQTATALPTVYKDGHYAVDLSTVQGSPWLLLRSTAP